MASIGGLALSIIGFGQSFDWVADPLQVAPGAQGVCVTFEAQPQGRD